jgi:hypothetical protein
MEAADLWDRDDGSIAGRRDREDESAVLVQR